VNGSDKWKWHLVPDDGLPTKDNLTRRGKVQTYLVACLSGCRVDGNIDHMVVTGDWVVGCLEFRDG
ncbi:hypothetical protein A2U01_0018083, partial [Trifolium medium]|nr:hypothetical protein [Trifolium medium]